MNKPEYECAELFHLCLNEGIIVVELKSNRNRLAKIYNSVRACISICNSIRKSVETFLPISAPKPDNKPPSLNPIAESTVVPMANPPATPAPTISSLTMFFFIMGLVCYLIQQVHRMI